MDLVLLIIHFTFTLKFETLIDFELPYHFHDKDIQLLLLFFLLKFPAFDDDHIERKYSFYLSK